MNPLSKLLNQHVSIRNYKPEPIAQTIIDEVCADAIAGGSSSGNLNSVSVVLTRDAARKAKLWECHHQQPMVLQAPLVMTFCADWFRTREWLRARGARDNFNNFLGYHVAAFDAMIVAQNVCLGFEARGIGICYMGTTLHSMGEIADFLELPETCVPVTSIVAGYPNEAPSKRDRLPAHALVHDERYCVPTARALDATYAEREVRGWERYMSMPALKKVIEENGITSLAQFYTSKVKYDPEAFARDSREILNTLRNRKFME
jgi:nitroreductase